jgi:CRISPR system Cascade subunit CasE
MHAAVLSSFAPNVPTETEEGRVLWRVDRGLDHSVWLYLVSPEAPEMVHLVEQAGWQTQGAWETRDYDPFLARIAAGQRWAFRIMANPVHTVTERGVGKRVGHVTAAQQQRWFLGKTESAGFAVSSTADEESGVLVSHRDNRTFRRGDATVTLTTAQFDGRLEVLNASKLRHVLTHGLGKAKGYGCGLLTLAPVQR